MTLGLVLQDDLTRDLRLVVGDHHPPTRKFHWHATRAKYRREMRPAASLPSRLYGFRQTAPRTLYYPPGPLRSRGDVRTWSSLRSSSGPMKGFWINGMSGERVAPAPK